MDKKVGDYEWRQLSMWDLSPKKCIEKFIKSEDGQHVFHYYLLRIKEKMSDTYYKTEVVNSPKNVPTDILNWRTYDYKIKE